jgi:bifunctional non-homologous end joining protein LigD
MGRMCPKRSQSRPLLPIFTPMLRRFEFCIPTRATIVPHGPDWLHEVKYDGYRLRVERDGYRGRRINRHGQVDRN